MAKKKPINKQKIQMQARGVDYKEYNPGDNQETAYEKFIKAKAAVQQAKYEQRKLEEARKQTPMQQGANAVRDIAQGKKPQYSKSDLQQNAWKDQRRNEEFHRIEKNMESARKEMQDADKSAELHRTHDIRKLDPESLNTLMTLYKAEHGVYADKGTMYSKGAKPVAYVDESTALGSYAKKQHERSGQEYVSYNRKELEEQFKKKNGVSDRGFKLYQQYLKEAMNTAEAEDLEKLSRDYADKHPIAANATDVVVDMPAGFMATAESVRHKFDADPYSNVNTNSALYRAQNFQTAVENQTNENIAAAINNPYLRAAAQVGYGAGLSTAKMVAPMALGGLAGGIAEGAGASELGIKLATNAATLPSFGVSAYSHTLKEAQDRGLSRKQATQLAVVSAVSEMGTEVVSLDVFWDIAKQSGVKAARNRLVNWLVMAGIEGSEEGANDIINRIADDAIAGDQSEYNSRVRELIENNELSEEEAKKIATHEYWAQVRADVLAGSLSGGLMGGGTTYMQSRSYAKTAKHVNAGDYMYVVDELPLEESAYENKEGSDAAKEAVELAQTLAKKVEEGTEVTKKEKTRLVELVDEARQNMSVRSEEAEAPAEEKHSKAQIMADMSKAKNARELTKAYHEAVENIPAENRQDADTLFNIKAGQLNLTTAQVNSARMSDADVYNAGYENKRIEHLTPQQQVTYREGAMKRFEEEAKARATAEVTGKASNDAGKEFTVKEIKSLDSNDMMLLTDDGEVKLSQVKFANDGEQTLYNQAAQMGSVAAAKAYVDNYVPGMPVDAYDRVAQKFYTAGQLRTSFDSMRIGPVEKQVGTEGLRALYDAGMEVDKSESKIAKKTTKANKGEGRLVDSRENKGKTLHRGFLGQVAEKFGIDIEITDSLVNGENGTFDTAKGLLILNSNNPDMYKTLFHELSEFGQAYNAEGMEELRIAMMEYMMEKAPDSLRQNLIAYQNAYRQHTDEKTKSISEASEELFNDMISEIFRDEAGIQDFVSWVVDTKTETEAQGLIQRLAELIQKICDSISKYVSGNRKMSSAQKVAAKMDVQRAQEMRSKLLQAFDEAIKNRDALVGQEGQAEARHSLNVNNYGEVIDSAGRPLSNEQISFFKDSAIRDENDCLKRMYHGTEHGGFTVFDAEYSDDGISLFFTDKLKVARAYSGTSREIRFNYGIDDLKAMVEDELTEIKKRGDVYSIVHYTLREGKDAKRDVEFRGTFEELRDYVIETYSDEPGSTNYAVYLNIKNPLVVDADNNYWDEIPENEKYIDEDLQRSPTTTREYAQYAKKNGYDGVVFNNIIDNGLYADSDTRFTTSQVVIAFEANQVKSVENKQPTNDSDIRYSIDVQPERVFYTKAGTEVVQNPTSQEYSQMREDILQDRPWMRGTGEPLFRHTYDEQGNEYYWDAMGGLHAQVEPEINKKYNTRTSQQWNWWTREDKDDYPVDYSKRYSINVDSEGRNLTVQQQEYFKDSKIVDEQGRLRVLYHGTDAEFYVFDPVKFGGKNGRAEGYGIYLSDSKQVMEVYGAEKGIEAYVNITHPASRYEKNITVNELKKLIEALCVDEAKAEVEDGGYDSIEEALPDTWVSNYVYTPDMTMNQAYTEVAKQILNQNSNDADIVQEIMLATGVNDYKTAYEFYDILRESVGIDGLIARWEQPDGTDIDVIIAFNSNQVKRTDNLNPTEDQDIRHSLDVDYMDAYKKNDTRTMDMLVNIAAMQNGFSTQNLYHGTQRFGFTKMDMEKMDDKQTIFLTSNPLIASTYSGTTQQKKISEAWTGNPFDLSMRELEEQLNNNLPDDGIDRKYVYYDREKLEALKTQIDKDIAGLGNIINNLENLDNQDKKVVDRLKNTLATLSADEAVTSPKSQLGVDLWFLATKTLEGTEQGKHLQELEANIRRYNTVNDELQAIREYNESDATEITQPEELILEDMLDGYSVETLNHNSAAVWLRRNAGQGIYKLYAKLGNMFVVDANGANWDLITNWTKAYTDRFNMSNTKAERGEGNRVFLLSNNETLLDLYGQVYEDMNDEELHKFLVDNLERLYYYAESNNYGKSTRAVVKWAKAHGFDSVVFTNIRDNGGRSHNVSMHELADVYAVFNPNSVKSADTVTLDDNGEVIPPSERFQDNTDDMRYSLDVDNLVMKSTGEKISKEFASVLKRLNNKELVPLDEIYSISEIKKATLEAAKIEATPTNRNLLHNSIINRLIRNNGFANKSDMVYNKDVEKGHKAFLVLGLPASGKSSVITNRLLKEHKAFLLDSDEAKQCIPEFENGIGAGAVHAESKEILSKLKEKLLDGSNVVNPIVGSDEKKVLEIINLLHTKGYYVGIHFVETTPQTSLSRMLTRYITDNRFLQPWLIYDYMYKPLEVFEKVKGVADEWTQWNNEVEYGEKPIFRGSSSDTEIERTISEGRRIGDEVAERGSEKSEETDIRNSLDIDNDFGMWDTEDLQGTFIDEDGQELDLGNSVINAEETISGLARYLQAANEPLKGHKVNESALQQIAEDLVKKYNSTADVNVVADNLKIVFDYLQKTDDINYNEITKLLSEVSRPIIEQSGNVNEEMVELYEAFKGYIKGQKIALTDGQKKAFDLTPYGSFNNYRKANFGTLNFVNDGASLDSLWTEMCEKAKGFLDVDTNEEDMGIALADALTAMKPQAESLYGYDAREASIDLAGQIMEAYYKAEQEAIAQDMIESGMASPTAKYMIESARKDMKKEIMDYRKKTKELYNKQLEDMQAKVSEIMAANNALAFDVKNLEKKNEQLTKKMAEQVVKAKARNKTTELKRYVEAEEIKKQKEEINKIAIDLLNRATNPTNKKYMQEGLRKPIAEFLTGIDFVSHRARLDSKNTVKWTDRMNTLRKYLSDAAKGDEPEAIGIVLDPDLIEDMDRFVTRNSEVTKVSKLPSWDLKELHSILSRLRTAVNKSNEMFTNELFKNQVDFNQAAYMELKEQNSQKNINKFMNGIRDFLNKDLEDPVTYFELLGETHKTLFDSLLKGFDKRAEHIREYVEFMKKLQQGKEQFYKWENKKHTFQLEEGTLEITEAQIMSLYETMQREQAKGHILPSGFKVSKVTVGGKEIIQNKPVRIKPAEYLEIINTLSAEQKEVADAIQKFMAVNCAKWGNNTSMKLFGYKKFKEKNYFPIKTDATSRDTNQQDVSKQAGLWANKNMSASKELTIGANNAIVIGDIFDVFADHVTDMATYDGMVLPQMDAMRWFNYREIFKGENETGEIKDTYSIKEQLQRLMGTAGTKYFENLMLGINGMEPKARSASAMTKFIGNYKKAAVTAKIRVAIQQPTAIIRAMDEMNGKYISKALATTNFAKYSKIAQEKSNLAWWKAQGYYEAYLGKSIKDMAVGKNPALQAIDDYAGFGAQKADDLTWGALYHAVEYEIADTTDLKPGTEAFDAAVVDRFEDVVTKTQVVDTMIHRTDIMRNQNDFVKLATSFMAEPLKTYNMCLRSIAKFARAPHDKKMWRKLIRTIIVYTLNNAILTAVTSSWDAVRDDDDKTPYSQRWIDRYSKEFIDNMNPVNMLPYVKDVVELFESRIKGEYYSSTDMATAGFDKAATFLVHLGKVLSGEKINKTPYGLTLEGLQAIQTLSGMPIYNVVNDINTVHNGLTDNWETKQSTSDYGDLHKAITKDKDVKEEVQELLEMGKDKSGIKASITSKFKAEYQEATGEDKQQIRENVTEALVEAGYTKEEAQNTLDKWDGVETTEPQYEEYHSDYESVYDSIDKGGNVQSEVQKMLDSGKQPAGIKSAITRKYKDQLVQTRDANLRNALVRAYMAAGDTNEEANEKIDNWFE